MCDDALQVHYKISLLMAIDSVYTPYFAVAIYLDTVMLGQVVMNKLEKRLAVHVPSFYIGSLHMVSVLKLTRQLTVYLRSNPWGIPGSYASATCTPIARSFSAMTRL